MPYDEARLQAHYESLPEQGGFDSVCDMKIKFPEELHGRRVLDLGCRRGKGVYHIASRVGQDGSAVGVDWRADLIEKARAGEAHALSKCPFDASNMEFICAYPERLSTTALQKESFDVIYTNSVLNLMFDPVEALRECFKLLKPGGLLACRTVLAATPRDAAVIEAARTIGNAVQAAPHRRTFAAWLGSAGFDMARFDSVDRGRVPADAGVREDEPAPTVDSNEKASFVLVDAFVRKADGSDHYRELLAQDIAEFR